MIILSSLKKKCTYKVIYLLVAAHLWFKYDSHWLTQLPDFSNFWVFFYYHNYFRFLTNICLKFYSTKRKKEEKNTIMCKKMGCGKERNELSNLVDSLNLIGCNLLFCINFAWFNGFLPFCKQDSVVSNTNDAHWVFKKKSCCDSVHIMLSFENTL